MEEIIIKECTNQELSESERIQLQRWLDESPKNRKIYAQIKLTLLSPGAANTEKIKEEVWSGLRKRQPEFYINVHPASSTNNYLWLKVAAILFICFSFVIAIYQMTENSDFFDPNIVEIKYIEKVSLPGQKITTRLQDGTKVTLNSASRIVVPEKFNNEVRKITLKGEAFFDVSRDESRPFIIKTEDIEVEVLGTSFNVKSFPEEGLAVVAVESGKVAVSTDGPRKEKVHLLQGERVKYRSENKSMEKGYYNREEEFGWKENVLLFHGKNFSEILTILSRWYGVEFKIQNPDIKFNETFNGRYKDASLEVVLDGLSYVYDFKYQIEDKMVILK